MIKFILIKLFIADLTDECGLGTHNCDVNALCINNNVSFICECLLGFNGTGTIGTCSGNMNLLSFRKSLQYEFKVNFIRCHCNFSFTFYTHKYIQKHTRIDSYSFRINLLDINECAQNTYTCDALASCVNNVGSYTCRCQNDYIGDGTPGNCLSKCKIISICIIFTPNILCVFSDILQFLGSISIDSDRSGSFV